MRAEKNLPKCMFISSGLRSSPSVDSQSLNMSLSVLHFVLTFFISAVSVCCMLPRLSCILTSHNDIIDCPVHWYGLGTSLCITHTKRYVLCTDICVSHIQRGTFYVQICEDKWLTMFFKTRWRFSVISHRRTKPLGWEMTEKRPRVLKNILNYFIAMIVCLSRIW